MKSRSIFPLWVLKNIEELIAGAALITMILITALNVICRYAFRSPIHWAEELSVICLVWSTFLGSAACYKRKSHLGMDFVISSLPGKIRYAAQQLLCLILLVFFVYICGLSFEFALSAEKTTPFFHLSYFYLYISAALSFLSMSIYSLVFLVMSFRNPEKYYSIFVARPDEEEQQ